MVFSMVSMVFRALYICSMGFYRSFKGVFHG